MSKEVRVVFQPSGRTVHVLPGTILLEAAARAGLIIETPCGGQGNCGKCVVRVVAGECSSGDTDIVQLDAAQIGEGYKLACRAGVEGEMVVEIPETSLLQAGQKILTDHLGSDAPTVTRGPAGVRFGLAYDIGTTTLVATLVDLGDGRDLAVASAVNPQVSAGDDVVSRIKKCRDEPNGLHELHEAVLGAVNDLAARCLADADLEINAVEKAAFAGNTTMQHIICGVDPSPLGELPFIPPIKGSVTKTAREFGLAVNPEATVYLFPAIGGFVGGDTVAGVLATDLQASESSALFVDVGTNGEMVLAHNGKLISTSVAAGPAFEGARIINGMRAVNGAIEKVVLSDDVHCNVIGNVKAVGLCGTGLLDAVAGLLRAGIVDSMGRVQLPDELPADLSDALRQRVVEQDGRCDFILVDAEGTASGEPLYLYQKDIRELQLANGAIRAGTNILMKTAGIEASDLGSVLLAGGFGNFVRRDNALRIGMLPPVPAERIRFVGNTASFGAKCVLLSDAAREIAGRLAELTEHVDLSLDPAFQQEFGEAMIFPES